MQKKNKMWKQAQLTKIHGNINENRIPVFTQKSNSTQWWLNTENKHSDTNGNLHCVQLLGKGIWQYTFKLEIHVSFDSAPCCSCLGIQSGWRTTSHPRETLIFLHRDGGVNMVQSLTWVRAMPMSWMNVCDIHHENTAMVTLTFESPQRSDTCACVIEPYMKLLIFNSFWSNKMAI